MLLRLVQVCCLPACEQGEGKVSENIQNTIMYWGGFKAQALGVQVSGSNVYCPKFRIQDPCPRSKVIQQNHVQVPDYCQERSRPGDEQYVGGTIWWLSHIRWFVICCQDSHYSHLGTVSHSLVCCQDWFIIVFLNLTPEYQLLIVVFSPAHLLTISAMATSYKTKKPRGAMLGLTTLQEVAVACPLA